MRLCHFPHPYCSCYHRGYQLRSTGKGYELAKTSVSWWWCERWKWSCACDSSHGSTHDDCHSEPKCLSHMRHICELWTADYHENSSSLRMYDQTWERILTHFLPRRTEIHRTMHKSPFCSLEMILPLKCRRRSLAVVSSYDIGHKPSHRHALSSSSVKPTRFYLPSEAALSLWDPYPKL